MTRVVDGHYIVGEYFSLILRRPVACVFVRAPIHHLHVLCVVVVVVVVGGGRRALDCGRRFVCRVICRTVMEWPL